MIDEENESSVEHGGSVLIPVVKVLVFANYTPSPLTHGVILYPEN